MARDIDVIIERLRSKHPEVQVEQLRVMHPGDDDGLWYFRNPQNDIKVQLESTKGVCPFLVESSAHNDRADVADIEDALKTLEVWLGLDKE